MPSQNCGSLFIDSSLDASMKTLRKVIHDIKPWDTAALPVQASIRSIAHRFFRGASVKLYIHTDDIPDHSLTSDMKNNILAVISESLSNVRQHASAAEVEIYMLWKPPWIEFTVNDNGKGFIQVENNRSSGFEHIGLISMRERAAMIGGNISIISEPGKGTKVVLNVKPGTA
jgi:two-component system NarL family sensor kinase